MDAANEILAAAVVRMGFAAEDDLQRTNALRDLGKTLRIREDQVGALVRRGATREADREHLWIERDTGARGNRLNHCALRFGVRGANLRKRNADGVAEIEIVRTPLGNALVEQTLNRR